MLPTDPGFYVADRYPLGTEENYMPYYLDGEGQWWEISEPGSPYPNYSIGKKDIEMYGPLIRLDTSNRGA